MKRRKKDRKPIMKKISYHLDIPEDVLFDVPRITLLDNTEIRIENYKTVLEYDNTKISLACKDKFINIAGQNLNITIITDDEVSIKGEISNIDFS